MRSRPTPGQTIESPSAALATVTHPTTIPALFAWTANARRDAPALGVIESETLRWLAWNELADCRAAWSRALAQRGVSRGDRVAQFSPNCLGWILSDMAIQTLGAVHVPLHASLAPAEAALQASHCGARMVLAADSGAAGALGAHLPTGIGLVTHSELMAASDCPAPPTVDPAADDLATILYTSGTTGAARGAMLTHQNLVSNAISITRVVAPPGDETRLCLLPLSHIYARTCDLYSWMVSGAKLVLAESRDTIFRDCRLARPTAINAVPYFYQKVMDRLHAAGSTTDATALRDILGGEVQRCFCGGAALPTEVDRFFAERGLPIHCGYGLTEASPVITATSPGDYGMGTVGRPLPEVDVRLADDGEIVARGPNIMQGYWDNESATKHVLRDGWLYTEDLGEWDEQGRLRIIGRKKEMIVLATGKKVAPTRLEERLVGSPLIEQACVVGDGRKCIAAIVVPNGDALRNEIKRRRLLVWSRRRALRHPKIVALYHSEINRCLSGLAAFEQVGAFTLIDRAFALDRGEVTLKLSLCRDAIHRNFAREIDAMYRTLTSR